MTCPSCVQKVYEKLLAHNVPPAEAWERAKKGMKWTEARRRKERIRHFYKHVDNFLWKWTFLWNWKASFLWSVKLKRFLWIGKAFNPDYTLACTGTCTAVACPNYGLGCADYRDCRIYATCPIGTCSCQAALPNSVQVSNSCNCGVAGWKCLSCSVTCQIASFSCACVGTCGYNCDPGFHYDGAQCVPNPPPSTGEKKHLKMDAGPHPRSKSLFRYKLKKWWSSVEQTL